VQPALEAAVLEGTNPKQAIRKAAELAAENQL
jgi:hypothetical protein